MSRPDGASHRILIRNADVVVTMDDARSEPVGCDIAIKDGVIERVEHDLLSGGIRYDEIVDATGTTVTPGLINTHHHFFQSLTKAVPEVENASLFGWLKALYPIWARMTPEDVHAAVRLGLGELALSGCTMSSDHHYLYPNGVTLDDTIDAAETIGLRFHATRGSVSLGESAGGLPPDGLVEEEADILADSIRLIDRYHDASPGAHLRIGLAPCSPFSVTEGLMRDTALLARDKGVMLHTHLAENAEDVAYSQARYGKSPGDYAEELGWVGDDVWHAHCVKLNDAEIALFAGTGTGVAHCPCSNCRLGSGIAPIAAMRKAGVRIGLGVDGSASSDRGHLLAEARQAMLLQRVAHGADAATARQVLEMATRDGADILGRGAELGRIEPGMRADIAIWDNLEPGPAGAWDPVAALVLAPPTGVRDLIVEGRRIVRNGRLATADVREITEDATRRARGLMQG